MCLGIIKLCRILGDGIIALHPHTLVSTFNEGEAILHTLLRMSIDASNFCLLLLTVGVVSKHFTVCEGHGAGGMHGASVDYLVIIGSLQFGKGIVETLRQLAQQISLVDVMVLRQFPGILRIMTPHEIDQELELLGV